MAAATGASTSRRDCLHISIGFLLRVTYIHWHQTTYVSTRYLTSKVLNLTLTQKVYFSNSSRMRLVDAKMSQISLSNSCVQTWKLTSVGQPVGASVVAKPATIAVRPAFGPSAGIGVFERRNLCIHCGPIVGAAALYGKMVWMTRRLQYCNCWHSGRRGIQRA